MHRRDISGSRSSGPPENGMNEVVKLKSAFPSVEKISFENTENLIGLFGEHDQHLKLLEKLERVKLAVRGNILSITGDMPAVALTKNLILQLHSILRKGYPLYAADIDYAHRILS